MIQSTILYSTGCPNCQVLKDKLSEAKIPYVEINDRELIASQGISTVPVLQVGDEMMNFSTAIKWIKSRRTK